MPRHLSEAVKPGHECVASDMLEPRGADIPILFLVLVVLPVVAYILLGKWSDISEKRGRANLLAQMAAEEAFRAETDVRGVRFETMATENRAPRTRTRTVPAASGSVRADFVAELRPDSVAATCGVPVNNQGHVCARCFNPAKTRCSRCKSIRYWYIFHITFLGFSLSFFEISCRDFNL